MTTDKKKKKNSEYYFTCTELMNTLRHITITDTSNIILNKNNQMFALDKSVG